MLKNMKIKKSLLLGYAVTILISLVLIISSLFMMNYVRKDYNKLLTTTVSANLDITTARLNANIAARNVRDILLTPDDPSNSSMVNTAEEALATMNTYMELLQQNFPEGQDTSALNQYVSAVSKWESIAVEIVGLYEKYASSGNVTVLERAINMVGTDCTPALNEMVALGNEVDNFLTEYQTYRENNLEKISLILIIVLVAVMVVAAIAVVSLAFVLIRGITVPTEQVHKALVGFSQGKFDIPVDFESKNELGEMAKALRDSQDCLKNVVGEVSYLMTEMAHGNFALQFKDESIYVGGLIPMREAIRGINHQLSDTLAQITLSAEQVSAGSEQVSTGAQALAQGATEQASAVEELSATIGDIANNSQNNARGSEEAMEKTNYASSQLDESAHNMDEMVTAMDNISDSSQEIGKIIATIENIAFQTNILALNAAVEAARAGSAGKGFAVVADEVRNLATKSDEAAKATKELIDRSMRAVDEGNDIVKKVSASLKRTVDATEELKKSINSIAKAVEEESEAIAQVTEGIDQISAVVQTNSATSEQSAAASEELSSQAALIKDLMNKFKLRNNDNGYSAPVDSGYRAAAESEDDGYEPAPANNFSKY